MHNFGLLFPFQILLHETIPEEKDIFTETIGQKLTELILIPIRMHMQGTDDYDDVRYRSEKNISNSPRTLYIQFNKRRIRVREPVRAHL